MVANPLQFCVPVENTVSSNPPSGAVLLSYRHILYAKGKEKPFLYGNCGKAYKIKHSAYSHIKNNHEEKRYSCEFCGKHYFQQCYLTSHVMIHTQQKPLTCDQCGKRFRLEKYLRKHMYTPSEERRFPCKKCGKSFKNSGTLSKHPQYHNKAERGEGSLQGCFC